MVKDMEEICYQGTHFYIMIFVSLPGLLLWAAGIPIFALIRLKKNIQELNAIRAHSAGKKHEDLMRSFKIRLGFLTSGYEDSYYYWEIVLLMRKTSIVLLIVFLSSVSSGL